jgi:hypothetical protein
MKMITDVGAMATVGCPLGNESVFTLREQLRLLGPTIVDISIITDQAHNCIYHTGEYRIVGCPGYR